MKYATYSNEFAYLKDSEQGLPEGVKVVSGFVSGVVVVESAAKHLHAKQGKDDDEEEEK